MIMIKNKLKEIRMKEYMMNMIQFAEILDVNYRQYTDYEKGIVPQSGTMLRIAKKLNRPVEEIFYLED